MKTSFVEYNQFDPEKIKDVREYPISSKGLQMFTPMYDYTSRSRRYPLMIQTGFIDLTSDPFKYMSTDTKKYVSIDPNDNSASHMYKSFQDMAKFTMKYISAKHDGSKEMGPILSNYGDYTTNQTDILDTGLKMKNVKFFFSEKNNKIISTIYNYNKSRKYKSVEEFDTCDLTDIARFVTKGKQVRFILEPKIWYLKGGNYGTKLYIKYMEVRYKDQVIKSKLDEHQVEMHNWIKSVEI